MPENVVLLNSDKEILRGERDSSDYNDYSTRRSQIRLRVRKRGKAITEELKLLEEAGESQVAEDLLESILEQAGSVVRADLESKVERIESDLQRIEKRCAEIEHLRSELEDVQRQLSDGET